MDSIVLAALSEICSQCVNGIPLTKLWKNLRKSNSLSGLTLCNDVKKAVWNRILEIPGIQFEANKSSFDSQDPCIQSFEEAEKLGLKIIAGENLRDSFVGLYDLKAADAGISPPQRRALERISCARSDGITQSQLAKEFGVKGNKLFHIVRNLECQGLIVRQPIIIKTKEAAAEGETGSKHASSVSTNLIHLYRYAKHLTSQQRFEVTKEDTSESLLSADESTSTEVDVEGNHVKDDVVVKDYLEDLKSVCAELEKAKNKVLAVSYIKKVLKYVGSEGHRKWRYICNRLKDARLVEEFLTEFNNRKDVSCLRLLKFFDEKHFQPKPVLCGSDNFGTDQQESGRIGEQLLELPIYHQVYDMIAAEGSKGLTITEVCERLRLNNKINYSRLRDMFSRFGCHLQAELHNKSVLYRVWTYENFTGGSSAASPGLSADVVDECTLSNQSVLDQVLRDKSNTAISQLDSLTSKESFATPGKNETGRVGLELDSSPPKKANAQREQRILERLEDLQQGTSDNRSASRKRKKHLKATLSKHIKSVNGVSGRWEMPSLSESICQYTKDGNPITCLTGDHDTQLQECEAEAHAQSAEELETNGEVDQKDNYDFITQCAFSNLKPTCQPKFLWTEVSDRQLVIQYVRYHAAHGAQCIRRTPWVSLPDLPAPPEVCKRRMALLMDRKKDKRNMLVKLCALLSGRYAKHMNRSKEKELSTHDGSLIQEGSGRNVANCLEKTLESDFEDQRWDDFEDQNIRGPLEEVLRCMRRTDKLEGCKRDGLEKECPERNLDAQACDIQKLELSRPSTAATGEKMHVYFGKRKRRSSCRRIPGKFAKLVNEGISVSRRAYESLAVSNAVELLKLVFLSTSTASEVLTLLAETLRRYSENDLFAAFNYLREKKFMVGGNDSQPLLSPKFLRRVSSSPFPINTGERASKFASWLRERQKVLLAMEEETYLDADLQCGDIFHLLALVSSGELSMSPSLPDKGIGEADEKRSSIHRDYEDELCNGDQVKKPASVYMYDGGESGTRREKGFPDIKVSLIRAKISMANALEFFENDKISTNSSRLDEDYESMEVSSNNFISMTIDESPWKTMTRYSESLISLLSNEEQSGGPLYPELFQTAHSVILKSGDQGLSMNEVSQVAAIDGVKMTELVVDVLQVFGSAVKVNAYDHVKVIDASFRSKYFLTSADGRCQNSKSSQHMTSDDNYVKFQQGYDKNADPSMDLDGGMHKVTMLNQPKQVPSTEAQPLKANSRFQDNMQVKVISPEEGMKKRENFKCTTRGDSHPHSFTPILPWINGDGTANLIVYKAVTRRVFGLVMQNPGILEDDVINWMDTLNPQSCRKLLELMVLDNHLIVRKMFQFQTTSSGVPPALLHSLFGTSSSSNSNNNTFKKPKLICREHFFANPMSTSLL